MRHRIHGRSGRQLQQQIHRLGRQQGLAFEAVLPRAEVAAALQRCGITFRARVFNPAVTLWALLWQVLSSEHTTTQAVANVLAWRLAEGLPPCSANNGSYCTARKRLPIALIENLLGHVGERLHRRCPEDWRWLGRVVKVMDGATASMPDTPANQSQYPQARTQQPGLGFPIARLIVIFSLSTGGALHWAMGRYKGKMTGETSLLRTLLDTFAAGEIALADRLFGGYVTLALLQARGVDAVVRLHHKRKVDLRRGQRLGKGDHLVTWRRPTRPNADVDRETFDRLPPTMTLRLVTVHVQQRGGRTRRLTVVTTLLDADRYPAEAIADLYARRWEVELNLDDLKTTLQMDVLRCKTPGMVRKEVATHLLAYNLVRLLLAQAAAEHQRQPRQLSFTGGLQLLRSFHHRELLDDPAHHAALLVAIVQRALPHRPGRHEPRAVKRRAKPYPLLTQPRAKARKAL